MIHMEYFFLSNCCRWHFKSQFIVCFSYDATSVLDFLWACVHIPKIWQGRERKVPKVNSYIVVRSLKGMKFIAA